MARGSYCASLKLVGDILPPIYTESPDLNGEILEDGDVLYEIVSIIFPLSAGKAGTRLNFLPCFHLKFPKGCKFLVTGADSNLSTKHEPSLWQDEDGALYMDTRKLDLKGSDQSKNLQNTGFMKVGPISLMVKKSKKEKSDESAD